MNKEQRSIYNLKREQTIIFFKIFKGSRSYSNRNGWRRNAKSLANCNELQSHFYFCDKKCLNLRYSIYR